MQKLKNQLILLREDYKLLMSYLNGWHRKSAFDRRNAEELHNELKKAKLVSKDAFPSDVVRLNSAVKIKTDGKDEILKLTLVTPDEADIKENKISIMAPIGAALIGFRQGQKVKWHVPGGKKTFTIMEVVNAFN
jgi:regulator of nucleoside diphosphate kinase